MFPIIDSTGRVVGFGGRALPGGEDGEAKYINSPETPLFNKSRQLYGLNIARKTRAKEIIVVEGYMDVLALHQAGFANAVGVLGTALTSEHVRLLKRAGFESVVLILDSDEAGIRAAKKAIPELLAGSLRVKVLQFSPETQAKDPDEYLQKHGATKFGNLLAKTRSHVAFQVGLLVREYDLTDITQNISFTEEAAKLLVPLTSEIETHAYAKEISEVSGIATTAILTEVQKQRAVLNPDGQSIIASAPKRPRKNGIDAPGLNKARKELLRLVLTNPKAAQALAQSEYLAPEELGDDIYAQLLAFAFENAENKDTLAPADIVVRFETLEAQQKVAEIFSSDTLPKTEKTIEQELNDTVITIKQAWFAAQMDEIMRKNDAKAANALFSQKKNMSSLYITLGDG